MHYTIRTANVNEASRLTQLAIDSKRYWGYPESWIQAWQDQLTVTPEMIGQWLCYVAELDNDIKGFWCREAIESEQPSRGLLFVKPGAIRTGCGRQLWHTMRPALLQAGVRYFVMEGDPNAKQFYLKLGAEHIDDKASPIIPERYIPIFRFNLLGYSPPNLRSP